MVENNIFVVGKRVHGHHYLITNNLLTTEQLDGMNRKGWVLSRMQQQKTKFQYEFVKPSFRAKIIGW